MHLHRIFLLRIESSCFRKRNSIKSLDEKREFRRQRCAAFPGVLDPDYSSPAQMARAAVGHPPSVRVSACECRCPRVGCARVGLYARRGARACGGSGRARGALGAGRCWGLARPCTLGGASDPGCPSGSGLSTAMWAKLWVCDLIVHFLPNFLAPHRGAVFLPASLEATDRGLVAGRLGGQLLGLGRPSEAPRCGGEDSQPGIQWAPRESFRGPAGRPLPLSAAWARLSKR